MKVNSGGIESGVQFTEEGAGRASYVCGGIGARLI